MYRSGSNYLERWHEGLGLQIPVDLPFNAVGDIGSSTATGTQMIEVTANPGNQNQFQRLIAFADEVLGVCDELGIAPILSSSLAVFAYTQDPTLEVHDIDLSCSETHFPHLLSALEARGIACSIKSWHVLQAVSSDLKIDFDATEFWMRGLTHDYHQARIGNVQFTMFSVEDLRELYRRGFVATSSNGDEANRAKHQKIATKLDILDKLLVR